MSIRIIEERLQRYPLTSAQDEDYALREITQELILWTLYNAGFFKQAAFQDGTALRILHGLPRFSEDMDFALLAPDAKFDLTSYLTSTSAELGAFGYNMKVESRAAAKAVQMTFLKDDSIGRIIKIQRHKKDGPTRSLKIKLEVDTNPPTGANTELKFLDFPLNFAVTAHDLPTLFAGKCHALLCRRFVKGRDWFDFLWYAGQRTRPNLEFLARALEQAGPWQGKKTKWTTKTVGAELAKKIREIDWHAGRMDVARFLRPADVKTLDFWDKDFFLGQLGRVI